MDKVVPSDLQMEFSALGAMIYGGADLSTTMSRLKGSDFFRPEHGDIFHAISQLHHNGHPIDMVTMRDQLTRNGALERVGGQDYLVDLCEGCPSVSSLDYYVGIVLEKSALRSIISECEKKIAEAYDPMAMPKKLIDSMIDENVYQRCRLDPASSNKDVDISDVVEEVIEDMQKPPTAISSGFYDIDDAIIGMPDGRMVTLGGYPGDGKTSLALNLAINVAKKGQVLYFSGEMGAMELAQRVACSESSICLTHAIKGSVTDKQVERARTSLTQYRDKIRFIDEQITLGLIESKLRRCHKPSDPVRLVVVDYVQLMKGTGNSRYEMFSNISPGLKAISRKYNICVLVLSQFRRPANGVPDLPTMFMLKETGSLENDSDVVLLMGRPDYECDTLTEDVDAPMGPMRGYMERWLCVAKCRYGAARWWPGGSNGIRLKFHPAATRFADW